MKLIYISPLRYPSERAGSLFSVKSCQSFANEGVETELWIPWRRNNVFDKDIFDYYGVERNFTIRQFFAIDSVRFSTKAYFLLYVSFALSVFLYTLKLCLSRKISQYIFYSHEQFALFLLTFLSRNTFYEIHDFPGKQKIYNLLFRRVSGIVTTNTWKATELTKRFHLQKDRILKVSNAVDVSAFSLNILVTDARSKLGLPQDRYLFGYIGSLSTMGMEKGVSTAILALKFLPLQYALYVVGGEAPQDIELYRKYAKEKDLLDRIIFAGPVAHNEVPLYASACDYLVAPFPDNPHYSLRMSPMKIFEYMASKRPIITTNLPTLQEVLEGEKTALFVSPEAPEALARAIERLSQDKALGERLAENAYAEVREKYTWQRRAKTILSFISSRKF